MIQITVDQLRIAVQQQYGDLLWQITVLQAENVKLKAERSTQTDVKSSEPEGVSSTGQV